MSANALTRYRRWLKENPMTLVCVVSFGLGMAFVGLLTGAERGGGAFRLVLGGAIGLVGGVIGGMAFGAVFWALERIMIVFAQMIGRLIGVSVHMLARVWKFALALGVIAVIIWIVRGVLGLLKIGWAAL
jgi:hypothetical protein